MRDRRRDQPSEIEQMRHLHVFTILTKTILIVIAMKRPFVGPPVGSNDYLAGTLRNHGTGILGGVIWGTGMSMHWKEFRGAPRGTSRETPTAIRSLPHTIADTMGLRRTLAITGLVRTVLNGFSTSQTTFTLRIDYAATPTVGRSATLAAEGHSQQTRCY
jgi:hypothetical protein